MSEHHASVNSLETPFDFSDCAPRKCSGCGETVYDAPPLAGLLPMEKDGRTHSTIVCEVRAQLAGAQKENERVSNALALLQRSGLAARDEMRSEILTLRSRLTACEPVIEAVREYRTHRIAFDIAVEAQPQPANYDAIGRRFAETDKALMDVPLPAKAIP